MFYTLILGYEANSNGVIVDQEASCVGTVVATGPHSENSAVDAGLINNLIEGLQEGTNIKFELYNLEYLGDKDLDGDSILSGIQKDFDKMLLSGELRCLDMLEFSAEIVHNY